MYRGVRERSVSLTHDSPSLVSVTKGWIKGGNYQLAMCEAILDDWLCFEVVDILVT